MPCVAHKGLWGYLLLVTRGSATLCTLAMIGVTQLGFFMWMRYPAANIFITCRFVILGNTNNQLKIHPSWRIVLIHCAI